MYLRIERRKILFRLTQDEIGILIAEGRIEETMPSAWLQPPHFAAKIDDAAMVLTASREQECLTLHIPGRLAAELVATKPSKDGITVSQSDNTGHSFDVTLEIDVRKAR